VEHPEEDVLRPDVVVVEQAGFLLGQHHHPTGLVSETFEHRMHCARGVSLYAPNGYSHPIRRPEGENDAQAARLAARALES
jgi:hypothetical protein